MSNGRPVGLGSLPNGITAIVLEFAATEALMFLREVNEPLKRLAESCCSSSRLEDLFRRVRHLVEVTPSVPGVGDDAALWSHFALDAHGVRCLAYSRKSATLMEALARLRAVDSLMKVRPKWKCIDSVEKVDQYLNERFCGTPGFWSKGPGRGVYTEMEQVALPALFSACRWMLRGMVVAPAPRAICFYHAFVETMGADGMGVDGQPIQIPLLCWEPAN
eukprot:s154_g96.t1